MVNGGGVKRTSSLFVRIRSIFCLFTGLTGDDLSKVGGHGLPQQRQYCLEQVFSGK